MHSYITLTRQSLDKISIFGGFLLKNRFFSLCKRFGRWPTVKLEVLGTCPFLAMLGGYDSGRPLPLDCDVARAADRSSWFFKVMFRHVSQSLPWKFLLAFSTNSVL